MRCRLAVEQGVAEHLGQGHVRKWQPGLCAGEDELTFGARASRSMASARGANGTSCSTRAFMRSAGTVHSAASRANSSQRSRRGDALGLPLLEHHVAAFAGA